VSDIHSPSGQLYDAPIALADLLYTENQYDLCFAHSYDKSTPEVWEGDRAFDGPGDLFP
jgi:hypothetical protein